MTGRFPREIIEIMPGRAILQRDSVSLGDQFSYAFGTGDDGALGAYLATFRGSFAVAGLVAFDPTFMTEVDEKSVERALGSVVEVQAEPRELVPLPDDVA